MNSNNKFFKRKSKSKIYSWAKIVIFTLVTVGILTLGFIYFGTCEFKKLNIKQAFNEILNVENLRITPMIEDKCWMKVTLHVKEKGDVSFWITQNNLAKSSYISEAFFPDEKVRILSLASINELRRSNKEDYWLAGKHSIPNKYKILPFEIHTISDIISNYDNIVRLKPETSEKGLNETNIPLEKVKYYFVVYENSYSTQ